jgi:hypothetical protein
MLEFLQSYGLWIALGGVFVAMHWFGMGCCGGQQRREQGQRDGDAVAGTRGREKAPESAPKSGGGCH